MNNLKKSELRHAMKSLASEERALLAKLLQHIALVDREKLFLDWVYPSLFEYLTRELGYSSGAAYRRLEAARLLERIPELAEKISAGSFTITQAAQMQKALRQVRKVRKERIGIEAQLELVQALIAAPKSKSEEILTRELKIKPKLDTYTHAQADGSMRVEFTFNPEEVEALKRAQAKFSHASGGGLKETILHLARKFGGPNGPSGTKLDPKSKQSLSGKSGDPKPILNGTIKAQDSNAILISANRRRGTSQGGVAQLPTPNPPNKHIPAILRRQIHQRDHNRCQYRDKTTNQQCSSTHFLELDHIQPRFALGQNTDDNLRLYCRAHNQWRYEKGK